MKWRTLAQCANGGMALRNTDMSSRARRPICGHEAARIGTGIALDPILANGGRCVSPVFPTLLRADAGQWRPGATLALIGRSVRARVAPGFFLSR